MSIMLENKKREKNTQFNMELAIFQVPCIYPAIEKQVVKPTNMEI